MEKELKPFRGEGNGICKRCVHRDECNGLCMSRTDRLLARALELEEATRDYSIGYTRLDSYWACLFAMSELNECEMFKKKLSLRIKQWFGFKEK